MLFIIILVVWRPSVRNDSKLVPKKANYRVVNDGEMVTAIEQLNPLTKSTDSPRVFLAITSHHIPTAAYFIADLFRYLLTTTTAHPTFIVIGPDHYERCPSRVTISNQPFITSFGKVDVDQDISERLGLTFAYETNDCLASEHAIATEAPFIARAFPHSKIVGIALSSSATTEDIQTLADVLDQMKDKVIILESTDFSHYLPVDQARMIDDETAHMINDLDVAAITLKNLDSPPTLRLVIGLAKRWNLRPKILEQKNLYDLNGQADNTTGYINAVFEEQE